MTTDQSDEQRRSMSRGIAILAAKNADPDNLHAALPILRTYMDEGVTDVDLLLGMTNVAEFLLVRLEKLARRNPWDELQYLAEQYGER